MVCERTDFNMFLTLGKGVVVMKELIFNSFYFGRGCGGLERTDILTVSYLGGCCGLERTDFSTSFYFGRGCGGHEGTDF